MNHPKLSGTGAPPGRAHSTAGSAAAPNAAGQGQFSVPGTISDLALDLERNFGISSCYLVAACVAALGGAIGNSVRLRCRLWPRPLNGALQWLFVDRTQGRLSQAIDFITQDLSGLQDERLRDLNSVSRKKVADQIQWIHKKECLGSDRETGHYRQDQAELLRLQLRLKPLKLIRDPPPGQLAEAVARSGDHALLVLYSPVGVHRLCDAAAGKWAGDLLALEHGWRGLTLIPGGRPAGEDSPILEPAVSSLTVCAEADLSQLLEQQPLSHSILGCMIPMSVTESTGSAGTPGFSLESLAKWRGLIEQTNWLRESGQSDLRQLDPEAEGLLMEYWSESQSGSLQPEQKFLAPFGPVLAAKLSLGYQLALSARPAHVSVQALQSAIQLTKLLLRQGADVIGVFPGFGL